MQELIKITDNKGKKAVSARELHLFLEIETRFDTWVSRMMEYGFIENIDCSKLSVENQSVDWVLTIECAKHWSMMQRTDKGMQARNYFIECEKKLIENNIKLPKTFAEALQLAADQAKEIELQESKIKELTPKAEVYERISDAENLLDFNQTAKILGVGRNAMMKTLREKNILMANNNPYQKYIGHKLFEVKVKPLKMGNTDTNYSQTYVTGKGLAWLALYFK